MGHLQRCSQGQDRQRRDAAGQFGDDEEDRQQIDEPQGAERLNEGFQVKSSPTWLQLDSAAKDGALKPNWIVTQST